jgi:TonB family protein
MNLCGLVAACSLLLAQVSGVNAAVPATQSAPPLRVFRAETPGLEKPVAIETSNLQYTEEELKARIAGTISLEVTIGADGRVRDAMVTAGLPTAPGMEDRAVAVLSQWRFQPATLNGQTVAVRTTITFTMSVR